MKKFFKWFSSMQLKKANNNIMLIVICIYKYIKVLLH